MGRYALLLLFAVAFTASCGGGGPRAPEQDTVAVEATVGEEAAKMIEIASASGRKIGPQIVVNVTLEAKSAIELSSFWIAFKEETGGEREVHVGGPIAEGDMITAELRMGSPNVPARFQIIEIRETPKHVD